MLLLSELGLLWRGGLELESVMRARMLKRHLRDMLMGVPTRAGLAKAALGLEVLPDMAVD